VSFFFFAGSIFHVSIQRYLCKFKNKCFLILSWLIYTCSLIRYLVNHLLVVCLHLLAAWFALYWSSCCSQRYGWVLVVLAFLDNYQKLLVVPLSKQRTKGAAGEVVCLLGRLLVQMLLTYCCPCPMVMTTHLCMCVWAACSDITWLFKFQCWFFPPSASFDWCNPYPYVALFSFLPCPSSDLMVLRLMLIIILVGLYFGIQPSE
jgi:hypothetical protein